MNNNAPRPAPASAISTFLVRRVMRRLSRLSIAVVAFRSDRFARASSRAPLCARFSRTRRRFEESAPRSFRNLRRIFVETARLAIPETLITARRFRNEKGALNGYSRGHEALISEVTDQRSEGQKSDLKSEPRYIGCYDRVGATCFWP